MDRLLLAGALVWTHVSSGIGRFGDGDRGRPSHTLPGLGGVMEGIHSGSWFPGVRPSATGSAGLQLLACSL